MRNGAAAFDAHRYEVAAREFEVAYELSQTPALLFNAASAWEAVPDVERALSALHRFVDSNPDGPMLVDARARIEVLERGRPRVAPTPVPTPSPTHAPQPVATPVTPPVQPPAHPADPPRSHTWRVVGIASGATAAVLAGVGLGVYLSASRDFDTLQDTCAPHCAQSDADSIDRRATATNVFLGLSVGALALSVTSFVLDLTGGARQAPVRVSAMPIEGGALGALAGRF